MDFQLKRKKGSLFLSSGRILNAAFAIPSALGLWYLGTNRPVSLWPVLVTLAFLAGLTYRERWLFTPENISFRFTLFALTLQKKTLAADEVSSVQLKTFIRGENRAVEPGADRKWYQKEQGILKLIKKDDTEEILLMDTNKKTAKLKQAGEEIAGFLSVSFLINDNGPE